MQKNACGNLVEKYSKAEKYIETLLKEEKYWKGATLGK